jgi:cell division protein FtsN
MEGAPRAGLQTGPKAASLIPAINPAAGKTYKLQVGSFKEPSNAVNTYVKLSSLGLHPSYERSNDNYFRVVLAGIKGHDVQSVSEQLLTAGIMEAIIREE